MTAEMFNGWANRETWALMLHVSNDPGLSLTVADTARAAADGITGDGARAAVADAVRDDLSAMLDPAEHLVAYGMERSHELQVVAAEVGSVWRVDWSEVADAVMEGLGDD